MKRVIVCIAIIVLVLAYPLGSISQIAPTPTKEAIPSSVTGYYEDFSSVSDWTVSGDGTITTDGDIGNMSLEFPAESVDFYATISETNLYGLTYEFNVSVISNATGTLRLYSGAAYTTVKAFSYAGIYTGYVQVSGDITRVSVLIDSDFDLGVTCGYATFDYIQFGAHPDSIGEFTQTISGDTLYYPDSFGTEILLADASEATGTFDYEYNDHEATWALDATTWELDALVDATGFVMYQYLNFSLDGLYLESFSFNIYSCYEPSGNTIIASSICYHDGASWVNVSAVPDPYAWVNSSIIAGDMITDSIMLRIYLTGVVTSAYVGLFIDYAEAVAYLKTDNYGYMDSFSDVSDYSVWTGNAPSSDGDVLTVDCVGGGSYTRLWTDVSFSSLEGYYVEFRVWTNISISWLRLFGYTGDAHTGTEFGIGSYCYSWTAGTWITWKTLVTSSNAVESFAIVAIRNTAGDFQLKIDYLRIAPSDQMGWSHDGSTTEGLTAADETNFDYVFSSDGDVLTINTTVDTGSSYNGDTYLAYDTTSIAADVSATYYPFVHLRYKCYVDGGNYYVYFRYGGKTATLTLTTDNIWHDAYLNVAAGSSTSSANVLFRYYRNVVGQTAMLQIETVQAFGIANYTFSQHASTPTTDYYYVVNGTLIREASAAWYMELNHDPIVNISSNFRTVANISTSHLVSSGGAYDFGFYEYVDGVGEWVYDSTNFSLNIGYLTDFRIVTYSDIWISSILFLQMPAHWNLANTISFYFDMPSWNLINSVQAFFTIAFRQDYIDGWFMLAGMIMIPASTVYLVKGGKEEMSTEKFFIFLMVFSVGWALLLGGIF